MKKYYLLLSVLLLVFLVASCGGGGGGSATTGTATLTWTRPTTNADGSALTNLGGFKVYYGTTAGYQATFFDVGNVTSCMIVGLPGGATYYFVVRAYNTQGVESDPSTERNKTI